MTTPAQSWVYVIGSVDHRHVKIGRSDNVPARRDQLQTGSPFRLDVLLTIRGPGSLEKALHERFKAERGNGEWFDFGNRDAVAEITAAIREIRQPRAKPPADERIDSYLDQQPVRLPRNRFNDDGLRLEGVADFEGPCVKCGSPLAAEKWDGLFAFVDDEDRPACEDCATRDRPDRQAMLRVLRDCQATFVELMHISKVGEERDFLRAVHWGARWIWGMSQW